MTDQAPTNNNDDERKQLEQAGLYDALVYLHEQEHDANNCFCTTEISGAYSKVLDIFHRYTQKMILAEILAELKASKLFIETIGDETDKAVLVPYFDGRITTIEKEMDEK